MNILDFEGYVASVATTQSSFNVCAQSCPTLCNPVDCSLSDSSVHGSFFPSKNTGVGCHFLLQEIFLNQGLL